MKNENKIDVSSKKRMWVYIKIPPLLKFILKCIIQILLALTSIYVLWKTNSITNAANLLQINNAIQERTNAVIVAEMKSIELELWSRDNYDDNNSEFYNDIHSRAKLIRIEQNTAIDSLLNTYEFACIQYIQKKIDKKAFRLFYSEMIKNIRDEYSDHFEKRGSQEYYQAINKVYKEWYGDLF